MIRLTKLTDYGVVLLTHFAAHEERDAFTARELALATGLPQPTVGKLLKELTHEGLLASHRGLKGGYRLAREAQRITVADVITALDGPIALTECNSDRPGLCEHESGCAVRTNWKLINRTIRDALAGITLADLARPLPKLWNLIPLEAQRGERPSPGAA